MTKRYSAVVSALVTGMLFVVTTAVQAFDFGIYSFSVVRNGNAYFLDTFGASVPPTAPNLSPEAGAVIYTGPSPVPDKFKYTPTSYTIGAGNFSPIDMSLPIPRALRLTSVNATVSPASETTLAVGATINMDRDATSTNGLKPSNTFQVTGVWDGVAPGPHPGEAYFIELGDWISLPAPKGKTCECIRLGVQRQNNGTVLIRFWRVSIGGGQADNATTIGSATFNPPPSVNPQFSARQLTLKLKKSSATSNAITASYTYEGTAESTLSGTTDLFTARQYAVAAFKAITLLASASTEGTNQNLSLTANINVAGNLINQTGSIWVAALWNGAVFFNTGTGWVAYAGGPYPAYASNVPLADRGISVISGLDVSSLTGAIVIVGYGTTQQEMLDNQQYNIVYTVQ